MPEVNSAIIRLDPRGITFHARSRIECNGSGARETYYKMIKVLFKQPRKTIVNNLLGADIGVQGANSRGRKEEIIKHLIKSGINPSGRPQDLSILQLIELSKTLL